MRPEELGFGRLFEMIRDAVIVADAKTQRIVLWNAEAAKMFGYSASEALKLRVEELVPEPLKDARRVGITRYAKTGHGRYIDSDSPLEGARAHLLGDGEFTPLVGALWLQFKWLVWTDDLRYCTTGCGHHLPINSRSDKKTCSVRCRKKLSIDGSSE